MLVAQVGDALGHADIGAHLRIEMFPYTAQQGIAIGEVTVNRYLGHFGAPSYCLERALLHNKVKDSHEESDVIDGPDAQTDTAEVSHDQLVRI